MGAANEAVRRAIQAVAKLHGAALGPGKGSPAYITIGRRRIALYAAILLPSKTARKTLEKPRLLRDRVVLWLLRTLETALEEAVPKGTAVILTITAPIKLARKTAAALEEAIRARIAHGSETADAKLAMFGNRARVRVLREVSTPGARVIGFVHRAPSDAELILNAAEALLVGVGANVVKRGTAREGRWLVLADEDGRIDAKTYRQVFAQLPVPAGIRKVLLFDGRRVEALKGDGS